tara:strand:+ start:327 stop:620 length:294 start_codon:yes stop_codon:yes gene_type:complete
MATITHGDKGRTDVSSRSAPTIKDDAKFSKIKTVGAGITDLTGSDAGSSGFIITTAGSSYIWPTDGDSIAASSLTAKTLYEIGVKRVSGSGTVSVVY